MAAREIIKIQACGLDGNHGSVEYGNSRPIQADFERCGLDGQSATIATDGTPGSDAHVRVSYVPSKPGHVLVSGEGAQTGHHWELPNTHGIHLNCRGGEGGNGGRGQDGQQGGNGLDGRNATKRHAATAGGNGANGGAAGAGTNGANGGAAGNVFISVAEHDLDTLLAVTWDITGGKGGLSGTHGVPGEGGMGGRGGDGCAWTESYGNTVKACSRPGAPWGAPGAAGMQPQSYLSGGQTGPNGSCQIRVLMKDLTEGTYPDRYRVQVMGFDVVDENEDNINEPGEHLYVRNIRVQNFGGMPTPGHECPIKILIHGTERLQPIESEPLYLPSRIPPGATVTVPGSLRCLIRSESAARAPGQPFFAKDTVALIASFDRLGRTLPEFSGHAEIDIQYPLVLEPPSVLMSVAKGDLVRFHWTLRNISSKPYGSQSSMRRSAATVLVDPGSAFNLTYSASAQGGQAIDEIELLEPGAAVPIDQDFRVSEGAIDYSYAFLRLELHLSNPNRVVQERTVANMYGIQMQIAGKYTYDEYAQFLLVVNSHTPLHAIHQIRGFIWNTLGLRVDTFNISLYSSMQDPYGDKHVFEKYKGKSIILFGNNFPYFDAGDHRPWDLLDPWGLCTLAKAGTSIFIASPTDFDALSHWSHMVAMPVSGVPMMPVSSKDVKTMVKSIQKNEHNMPADQHGFFQLPAKKATPQIKKMNSKLPLKRFLAIRNEDGVALVEGLPKSAQLFASAGGFVQCPEAHKIDDGNAFMIIRALPFAVQVKMFWNLVGLPTSEGVLRSQLFGGLSGFEPPVNQSIDWNGFTIERKWLEALAWSIEAHIGVEVASFCSNSGWPDAISSKDIIKQLPLLDQLLSSAPSEASNLAAENADLLIGVLGTVRAATKNIGFRRAISQKTWLIQLGSRRAKLRKAVRKNIEGSLKVYAPSAAPDIIKQVRALAKATKKEIKDTKHPKRNLAPISQQRLVIKTGTSIEHVDLNTRTNKRSIAPKVPALQLMADAQSHHQVKRIASEQHGAAKLAKMIVTDTDEGADAISSAPSPIDSQPPTPSLSVHGVPIEIASELPSISMPAKIVNVAVAELPVRAIA